jgi:anti-anti-sigma regulatory factor
MISERNVDDITIFELKGDFRRYCFQCGKWSGPYNRAHSLVEECANPKVLLNLAQATGLGRPALGELVMTKNFLSENGGQLKLVRPPKDLLDLLDELKLLSSFEIFEHENEALQSFQS